MLVVKLIFEYLAEARILVVGSKTGVRGESPNLKEDFNSNGDILRPKLSEGDHGKTSSELRRKSSQTHTRWTNAF